MGTTVVVFTPHSHGVAMHLCKSEIRMRVAPDADAQGINIVIGAWATFCTFSQASLDPFVQMEGFW